MSEVTPPPPPPPPPMSPPPYGAAPSPYGASQPPSNNLVLAILTTILCCLPFGIVAIIKAAEVNTKWAQGDQAGAVASAAAAKKWSFIGIGVGLAVGVIYALFLVIAAAGSSY